MSTGVLQRRMSEGEEGDFDSLHSLEEAVEGEGEEKEGEEEEVKTFEPIGFHNAWLQLLAPQLTPHMVTLSLLHLTQVQAS